jgi:hypothetical protein
MSKQTPADPPLSPTLARLLTEDPDTWTLRLLWARMPLPLRQEAVQSVLEDDSAESAPLLDSLLRALARAGGFRAKMLEGQDPAKVALHAGRIRRRDLPGPGSLLSHFLTTRRRALLSAYLDALGVPHEEGKVEPGYDTEEEGDHVAHAAGEVREAFPADDVAVYLVALTLTTPNLATGVPAWLGENLLPRPERGKGAGPLPAPEAADEAETREPELIQEARTDGPEGEAAPGSPFTTLDRLLIGAVVDSAQEVRGAMGALELEDLVGEVVELNSDRHESYFHRGFLDAVAEHPWRERLPAENPARRAWESNRLSHGPPPHHGLRSGTRIPGGTPPTVRIAC